MLRPHRVAALALLVGMAGCAGSKPGNDAAGGDTSAAARPVAPGSQASLEPWLDSIRSAHAVPALVAVVLRSDTVLATVVTGFRRDGKPEPVIPVDRFQIGSNTKALTAVVLAALVERGTLSWTSTPEAVFPAWRDSMSQAFRTITVEQLLSHRAGVTAFSRTTDKDWRSAPKFSGNAIQQRRAFAKWLLSGTPVSPPGTKAVYSNAGYALVAVMAEEVAGKPWEELVRELVFQPLGMVGAFSWGDSADVQQPWGHFSWVFGIRGMDPTDNFYKVPPIVWPAGSVEVSPVQYAKFLQANLRGLRGHDTPMLRSETVRFLHRPRGEAGSAYALGWGRTIFEGDSASTHAGSAGAFYAVAMIVPSRDIAVAVITNAGGDRAALATRDALRALVRGYRLPSSERAR